MFNFLRNRKQIVVLNGETSLLADVTAGGSILGPLLYIYIYIYIYIWSCQWSIINVKTFADDTSLFSVVHSATNTAKELNNDLVKINRLAYQWKMGFNPEPTKHAQEVIFSRKTNRIPSSSHFLQQ